MRLSTPGRTAVYAVLVLGVAASMVACADEPVSPLAVDPPRPSTTPAPSRTITPSPQATPPRWTPRRTTPRPTGSPACRGPDDVVTVQANDELEFERPICLEAGGRLRIEGASSAMVSVDRPDLAVPYEVAGVVEVYFHGSGTVNVSMVRGTEAFVKPVVVRQVAPAEPTEPRATEPG